MIPNTNSVIVRHTCVRKIPMLRCARLFVLAAGNRRPEGGGVERPESPLYPLQSRFES